MKNTRRASIAATIAWRGRRPPARRCSRAPPNPAPTLAPAPRGGAPPASQTLPARAAERGANLGTITAALLRLLERYDAAALQAAILEAVERDVPHPNAVRFALERHRQQHGD